MLLRWGLSLGFIAVLLQVAVFLQPLLPAQYQISPVCETIVQALRVTDQQPMPHQSMHSHASMHEKHMLHAEKPPIQHDHDHHDLNHQCQYCTVYGNLVLPPELTVKEVLVRVQIRLVAFQQAFHHVYFALQRLFLLPQGRAPPVSLNFNV